MVKNLTALTSVDSGSVITREGTSGEMFIVVKGKAGLYKNYGKANEALVKIVKPREFYGEYSLFLGKNHKFTAAALENSAVLTLNKFSSYKFFITEQDAAIEVIATLCSRIKELTVALTPTESVDLFTKAFETVEKEEIDVFFSEINKDYSFHICRKTEDYLRCYPKRSAVIKEGQKINEMYIVLEGQLGVYDDRRKKIADIKQGNFISSLNFRDGSCEGVIGSLKDSTVLALNADNIHTFLKYEPKSTFLVIQILCERLERLVEANKPKEVRSPTPYDDIIPIQHIHGKYDLPIETKEEYLTEKYFACPICGKSTINVITNIDHLRAAHIDDDSRLHYKDIEPIYYDIITCGNCWYTALKEYWERGIATEHYFLRTTAPYQNDMQFKYNLNKWKYTINDIFLAYYFAMFCVGECFNKGRSLIYAKIWLRLSWLYANCGDKEMEMFAIDKSHECFLNAFEESLMDDSKTSQPLLIIAGVVCHKANDKKNAKFFLSQAALARGGAEKRKEQARELLTKFGLR